MINKSVLVGRLTKDVELKKTPTNNSVVQFTLACGRNKKVEGQPEADFIQCVAWNGTADAMNRYLHKGSLIGVEGRLQTRSYEDRSGKNVYITELLVESMQFLEQKNNSTAQPQQSYQQPNYQYQQAPMNTYQQPTSTEYDPYGMYGNDALDIASDDLPF